MALYKYIRTYSISEPPKTTYSTQYTSQATQPHYPASTGARVAAERSPPMRGNRCRHRTTINTLPSKARFAGG